MTSAQIIIVVTIVLYLAAMVFVGVYFGKKGSGSSSDDFYLGGRKMGPVVTAMSAEASDMSSYLLMGLPGLAYLCGLPEVTWTAIGLAIGTYLNWLSVARRLRRYSAKLGAITIPDFFARRFGDKKHLLSCIAAVVILIFFIPYTASGFKAIGTLFNSLFGVEYHTAMIVGGIVVVLYTVMGGFMAVSFTDLIQSIFMTIALVVVVVFGIEQAGGLETVAVNAQALPGYLSMTKGYDVTTGGAASFGGLSIISTLAWGLGYFGMPHILLRFMAIKEEKKLNDSRRIATVWVVISMFIAVAIGVIGYSVSVAGTDFSYGVARRDIASLELVGEVENLTGRLVGADRVADALCIKAGVSKSNHSFVTPLCVFQKDVCVCYVVWFPAFWTARIPAPPANVDISMSPPQ